MANVDFNSKFKYKISRSNEFDKAAHLIDEELNLLVDNINEDEKEEICISKKDLIGKIDLSSFKPQKELNPKIWVNNKINSRVRLRLMDIADDFLETLGTTWVQPSDVILTGSLANYNWSRFSDFDLHVLMDFKKVDKRVDFVKDYFDSKKNEWNSTHEELKIYGFPVELYVQDTNEEHTATGVYSLYKNKWIVEPELNNIKAIKLNKYFIKSKALKFITVISNLRNKISDENDDAKLRELAKKVKKVFDTIKGLRKEGLVKSGEMSSGNIMYKILRRIGYIDILFDLKAMTYDKLKSIE